MNDPLIPDIDFYFNQQGLMVLTSHYLEKRGYCCKNGCLHCPYGFEKNNNPSKEKKDSPTP